MQRLVAVTAVVALALLASSCGSDESEAATTTVVPTTATTTVVPTTATTTTFAIDRIVTVEEMCNALDSLADEGLDSAEAFNVLYDTNLVFLDGGETGAFGELMVDAINKRCPQHADYVSEILYWIF